MRENIRDFPIIIYFQQLEKYQSMLSLETSFHFYHAWFISAYNFDIAGNYNESFKTSFNIFNFCSYIILM